MSIERVRILRYQLPLTAPVLFADGTTLDARQGLLLELTDEAGRTAYGDIAPLPAWSTETIQEAEAACVALLERAHAGSQLEFQPETQGDATAWHALPASVRCGLSMAMQQHWANEEGTKLYQLLCPFPRRSVALAPLITELDEGFYVRCDELRAQRPTAVKIKMGQRGIDEDAARVRRACEILGPECALRLDANRSWSFDEAVRFAKALAGCPVDYIEEPLLEARRLPEFSQTSGLAYALDESIGPVLGRYFDVVEERLRPSSLVAPDWTPQEIGALLQGATAVIVKPTLVGEFGRLVLMARHFANAHCRWVASAAYESGVGIAALAQLAGALDENDAPAGLDTYRRIARDVLRAPLPLEGPRAELSRIAAVGKDVDQATLEVVYGD